MYRVLTINPGSTSTKVGYFEGNVRIFAVTAEHDAEVLNQFSSIVDQLPYRRQTILEALEGRPFVGKAGRNLAGFLEALGPRRSEICITNVVKVRPTRVSPAGRVVNRPPSREEKALFTPWLMREVAVVRPQALVTLGNVALQAFVHDTIGQAHGTWRRAVVAPPEAAAFTLPLFALYHPASVIYNPALKERYEQDLAALAASLRVPSNGLCDI